MTETLKSYMRVWLDLRRGGLAPTTAAGYERLIEKYVPSVPMEGLSPLNLMEIEAVPMAAGYSRTAQLLHVVLRCALSDAVRIGELSSNPADLIKRPKHTSASPRIWSHDQIAVFLRLQSDSPLFAVWLLFLLCGLRRGEVLGLRWRDVDLTSGEIHITNQRIRVKGQILDCPPKSSSGRRVLYAPPPVLDALRALRASQSDFAGYVCPMTPEQLARALRAAQTASALPPISLHGLRHSMATACIATGVNPKVLQGILGHAHYSTTADFYCHRDTKAETNALDALALSFRA